MALNGPTVLYSGLARTKFLEYFPKLSPIKLHHVDTAYAIPTLSWVTREFAGHFTRYQKDFGTAFWEEETYDCDDFAWSFFVEARRAHALTPSRPKGTSLAIGYFQYVGEGTGGIYGKHAANCAIVGDGRKLSVITMEPQKGWKTELTQSERDSCYFLHF